MSRRRLAPLLRAGYRAAWWGLAAWSLLAAPRLRGVKCVVLDGEGRVLYVRHTYGDRRAWELPGGGAHRRESPVEAARREAREELGVDIATWRELGTVHTGRFRAQLELTAVAGEWPAGARLDPDPVEIAEAAWHASPPQPLGRITADVMPLVA